MCVYYMLERVYPLARWPGHLPPADDVHMEVVDRLAALDTVINHKSIALVELLLLGHVSCPA